MKAGWWCIGNLISFLLATEFSLLGVEFTKHILAFNVGALIVSVVYLKKHGECA